MNEIVHHQHTCNKGVIYTITLIEDDRMYQGKILRNGMPLYTSTKAYSEANVKRFLNAEIARQSTLLEIKPPIPAVRYQTPNAKQKDKDRKVEFSVRTPQPTKAKSTPIKTKEKNTAVVDVVKNEEIKHKTPSFVPKRIMVDEEKEKALLKMAKAQYQSYADVAKFAKALELRPGIVYLTLKHHSFIQQNETTQYRVLDAYYRNNGDLKAITAETGLTVWICATTLKQLGLSPNWVSYKEGNDVLNLGAWAEEEFKRLVPHALDMNMQYQMNNPVFDFMVEGKTIDVKASTLSIGPSNGRSGQYRPRIRGDKDNELADFYCLFLILDKEKPLTGDNYSILLIPSEVFPKQTKQISIVAKGRKAASATYWDFEVEPSALAAMLDSI